MSDLLDLRAVNASFALGPCAEVRVGEHAIRYVRRGSGPSVVLLDADADASPLWGRLVDVLASGHRIVIPQPPPDAADTSAWLRDFVEGLGLSSCVMVAGPALIGAALDLVAIDDFTVRKLILVANGDSLVANLSPRVLWIDANGPLDDALRRIDRFIEAA